DPPGDPEDQSECRVGTRGPGVDEQNHQHSGGTVESGVSEHGRPDGSGAQAQPAEEDADHDAAADHESETGNVGTAEVVAEQNERSVPQTPHDADDEQGRPGAQGAKAGEQPSPPAEFL